MEWFKAHHDARNDAKLKWIARETAKPFIEILGWWMGTLSLASESPIRGSLYMTPTEPYTLADISETLHTPLHETETVFQAYAKAGIVTLNDDVYTIMNWDKRQLKPDYSTPRVQKYRETEREKKKSETLLKRYCNGDETVDETHRKKKEEGESTPIPPKGRKVSTQHDADAVEFYGIYPRKKAKEDFFKAWKQMERERPPLQDMKEALGRQMAAPDWPQDITKVLYPATWIRGKRWEDEPALLVRPGGNGRNHEAEFRAANMTQITVGNERVWLTETQRGLCSGLSEEKRTAMIAELRKEPGRVTAC